MIKKEIDNLIKQLKEYIRLYDLGTPAISDKEYDELYFKLFDLEKKYYADPQSPTQCIPYEVKTELAKVKHNHPMLSLDKTKDWDTFTDYFKGKDVVSMLKLDGLTCSLRYLGGKLISAETRGDGVIGEDILHNAYVIENIPKNINYVDELIVDGEIICTYDNFYLFGKEYKNPRNYAAGSIRLLDSKECQRRHLTFYAWNIVKGFENTNSFVNKLTRLKELNFSVVPFISSLTEESKDFLQKKAEQENLPIDGLVGRFDDISYGESLGSTGHHAKAAYAYKFYDEIYETELTDIEWSMGRTGQITPVAIFTPIEIDGSIISRASLSNLSIMEETLGEKPFIGQKIYVSKRNMIMPKIEKAKNENGDWI